MTSMRSGGFKHSRSCRVSCMHRPEMHRDSIRCRSVAAAIPEVGLFDKWYNSVSGGKTPTIYAAYGWLSGMLFVQGINAGRAPTRAALINGLKTITSFGGNGLAAPTNPAAKTPADCFKIGRASCR